MYNFTIGKKSDFSIMLLQGLNDFRTTFFPKGDIKYKINNLKKYKNGLWQLGLIF